jgi:hypothetical protein
MGRDPDQVVVALERVVTGVTRLVIAVRQIGVVRRMMTHEDVTRIVEEARERKTKEYHVDEWEVGPYTRLQNGKEVRVRGYTAAPRKESHAS